MRPSATTSARLAAVTVVLGVVVVVLSQFVTAFVLDDRFGIPIETITLLSKHGPFVLVAAAAALVSLAWAAMAGSRQALIVTAGMGVLVILVFLVVDLPDAGSTGLFDTPGAGNLDATGRGDTGLWLELIGGLVILLGAASLATFDRATLATVVPGRNRPPRPRPGRGADVHRRGSGKPPG